MSCLMVSELTDAQIDAMAADLRKRIALFLITSGLDQLPAVTPNPPSGVTPGAVTAGTFQMENLA
jgi:hypothetical protein